MFKPSTQYFMSTCDKLINSIAVSGSMVCLFQRFFSVCFKFIFLFLLNYCFSENIKTDTNYILQYNKYLTLAFGSSRKHSRSQGVLLRI